MFRVVPLIVAAAVVLSGCYASSFRGPRNAKPPPELAESHCYRTLAAVDCYDKPDPYPKGYDTRVGWPMPTPTDVADHYRRKAFKAVRAKNWQRAEPLLKKALRRNPDDLYARLNLGLVYQKTGRARQAVPHLRRVAREGDGIHPPRVTDNALKNWTLADIAQHNLQRIQDRAQAWRGPR